MDKRSPPPEEYKWKAEKVFLLGPYMLTIQSEEAVFENTQKNLSHENVNFKIQTNVLKTFFQRNFPIS